jgi:hypothetical protein
MYLSNPADAISMARFGRTRQQVPAAPSKGAKGPVASAGCLSNVSRPADTISPHGWTYPVCAPRRMQRRPILLLLNQLELSSPSLLLFYLSSSLILFSSILRPFLEQIK